MLFAWGMENSKGKKRGGLKKKREKKKKKKRKEWKNDGGWEVKVCPPLEFPARLLLSTLNFCTFSIFLSNPMTLQKRALAL